jgi:hypothetical protein
MQPGAMRYETAARYETSYSITRYAGITRISFKSFPPIGSRSKGHGRHYALISAGLASSAPVFCLRYGTPLSYPFFTDFVKHSHSDPVGKVHKIPARFLVIPLLPLHIRPKCPFSYFFTRYRAAFFSPPPPVVRKKP